VAISEMAVSAEDPKQLSASVKSLPAGQYLVRYRVLSVDGHVVQDQFPFTVKP
jgi:methionine-rich copper-binding protein CopC